MEFSLFCKKFFNSCIWEILGGYNVVLFCKRLLQAVLQCGSKLGKLFFRFLASGSTFLSIEFILLFKASALLGNNFLQMFDILLQLLDFKARIGLKFEQ